jgi:hypothetical protein
VQLPVGLYLLPFGTHYKLTDVYNQIYLCLYVSTD